MKNKIIFLGLLFSAVFFTACSTTTVENNSIKPNISFTNTYFKALSLDGKEIEVFDREPHIKFQEDGKVFGNLGCNRFFGSFTKENNSINFQGVASTKMMCPNIKTEDAFSKVLQNTKTYEIKEESLILFDKDKKEIAKFNVVYF